MGTTLGNYTWQPGKDEPIDWHITPSILGGAAAFAAEGRTDGALSSRRFVAASSSEAASLLSMNARPGDEIYQSDLRTVTTFGELGWKMSLANAGVPYTPSWVPLTHFMWADGNTVQEWFYWVDGEVVTVRGSMKWTVGTALLGNGPQAARVAVPSTLPVRYIDSNIGAMGVALAKISGDYYMGQVSGTWGSSSGSADTTGVIYPSIRFLVDDTNALEMMTGAPTSWAEGSSVSVQFSYIS